MPANAPAAISGTLADFKLVKTRSVLQLVVEIPVESAAEAIALFGVPMPGQEVPVALARLVAPPPVKTSMTASDRFHALSKDEQMPARAAMWLEDPEVRKWLCERAHCLPTFREADLVMKQRLGIKSKSELGTNPEAAERFRGLQALFTYKDQIR